MDTQNLQQDVEIPQRWINAIVDGLAAAVAGETPAVDMQLMAILAQKAAISLQRARHQYQMKLLRFHRSHPDAI
jgi:hypothetical protein